MQAKTAAENAGGYLATITSAEENAFIVAQFPDAVSHNAYLGGIQLAPKPGEAATGWSWVTGEAWSYTRWYPNEPNDFMGGEHALAFAYATGPDFGTWNDVPENYPEPGYVLEYETSSVPDAGATGMMLVVALLGCRWLRRP